MTMVYQTSVEYKIKICFDRSGVSFFYLVGEGGMNLRSLPLPTLVENSMEE